MPTVTLHREVRKDLKRVPARVRSAAEIAIGKLAINPLDPTVVRKAEKGWGKRRVYSAELPAEHRMSWEVEGLDVLVWMVGSHEGFYDRLRQRARQ